MHDGPRFDSAVGDTFDFMTFFTFILLTVGFNCIFPWFFWCYFVPSLTLFFQFFVFLCSFSCSLIRLSILFSVIACPDTILLKVFLGFLDFILLSSSSLFWKKLPLTQESVLSLSFYVSSTTPPSTVMSLSLSLSFSVKFTDFSGSNTCAGMRDSVQMASLFKRKIPVLRNATWRFSANSALVYSLQACPHTL